MLLCEFFAEDGLIRHVFPPNTIVAAFPNQLHSYSAYFEEAVGFVGEYERLKGRVTTCNRLSAHSLSFTAGINDRSVREKFSPDESTRGGGSTDVLDGYIYREQNKILVNIKTNNCKVSDFDPRSVAGDQCTLCDKSLVASDSDSLPTRIVSAYGEASRHDGCKGCDNTRGAGYNPVTALVSLLVLIAGAGVIIRVAMWRSLLGSFLFVWLVAALVCIAGFYVFLGWVMWSASA